MNTDRQNPAAYSLSKGSLFKDILQAHSLFIVLIGTCYFTPAIFQSMVLALLLGLFAFTRKDHLWLAIIFVVESNPGGLFHMLDRRYSLALLRLDSLGIVYFWMPILVIALLKALIRKRGTPFFLREVIFCLLGYLLVLIPVFGVWNISGFIRLLFPWCLLFVLPRFFRTQEDYFRFFNIVSSFVVWVLLFQIVRILGGQEFAVYLGADPTIFTETKALTKVVYAIRPIHGIFICFMAIWGALLQLSVRAASKYNSLLYTVMGVSLFSIFLSATRAWLMAAIFIVIAFFVLERNLITISFKAILPAFFILGILSFFPLLYVQMDLAIKRYLTVESLLRGNYSSSAMADRFSIRAPKVMSKAKESPIFGFGFGREAMAYSDGHVGHQNILLHNGFIGYALFIWLWLAFVVKLLHRAAVFPGSYPLRKAMLLCIALLIGTLIIHTTAQWYGYLVPLMPCFAVCILYTFASRLIADANAQARPAMPLVRPIPPPLTQDRP